MSMNIRRLGAMTGLAAMIAGCGGGDSSSAGGTGNVPVVTTPAPTPTPTPVAVAGCSLRERQDWAAAQLREWYLFPETLPASLDPGAYSTVDDYIDAMTATARSQSRDRYFTYLTSIAEENAYYESGSSAGLGVRLGTDSTQRRLFVIEAFENGPALAAGIDRGTEILAIGTSSSNLRTVGDIAAASGLSGVSDALGPDTVGTTRFLRIADAGGTRTVSVAKSDFALTPVSSRYGTQVINDGGRRVGYVNLRTFISTADPALRAAFATFKAQGISDFIVDFRYNGGGLIQIAELMSDLLGGNRSTADVLSYTTFRPEKSEFNETRYFMPQPQSVVPNRIAFIGTGGTASASELVINSFIPYLHGRAALIGTNTYGKPVGQIGLDKAACDDRLRVVALATQNSARQGAYYTGLAGTVEASCRADDDISYPMGNPQEASTRAALDFLAGRSCTPISASVSGQAQGGRNAAQSANAGLGDERTLLIPTRPAPAQRDVPGLF